MNIVPLLILVERKKAFGLKAELIRALISYFARKGFSMVVVSLKAMNTLLHIGYEESSHAYSGAVLSIRYFIKVILFTRQFQERPLIGCT